jgi:flagellar motility protein MotE (MotC chaperone)
MDSGYKKFFQEARSLRAKEARSNEKSQGKAPKRRVDLKGNLKIKRKRPPSPSATFPFKALVAFIILTWASVWALVEWENIERYLNGVQVSFFGQALAEADTEAGKKQPTKDKKEEKKSSNAEPEQTKKSSAARAWTEEELALFTKLEERKKNLDLREEELNKMEAELQKQKVMIEKKIDELGELRKKIANQLKVQVEVDEERVKKLVDFYSNMKPANAAKIVGDLNEDLAVEVLGRMKKKDAAAIMNLLDPGKSKRLSEKYAGYVKR